MRTATDRIKKQNLPTLRLHTYHTHTRNALSNLHDGRILPGLLFGMTTFVVKAVRSRLTVLRTTFPKKTAKYFSYNGFVV